MADLLRSANHITFLPFAELPPLLHLLSPTSRMCFSPLPFKTDPKLLPWHETPKSPNRIINSFLCAPTALRTCHFNIYYNVLITGGGIGIGQAGANDSGSGIRQIWVQHPIFHLVAI